MKDHTKMLIVSSLGSLIMNDLNSFKMFSFVLSICPGTSIKILF